MRENPDISALTTREGDVRPHEGKACLSMEATLGEEEASGADGVQNFLKRFSLLIGEGRVGGRAEGKRL